MHLLGPSPGRILSCIRCRLVTVAGLGTGHAELKEQMVGTSLSHCQKATSLPPLVSRTIQPLHPRTAKSPAPPDIVFSHLLPDRPAAHGRNQARSHPWKANFGCVESAALMNSKCHVLAALGKTQQRFPKYPCCLCCSIRSSNSPLLGTWKAVRPAKVSSRPAGSGPRLHINQLQVPELRELINKTFPSPGGSDHNEAGKVQANTKHY